MQNDLVRGCLVPTGRRAQVRERLCRLQVDDKLDFDRILDRQVSWLLPFDDPAGVDACLSNRIRQAAAAAHRTDIAVL
jgi:hypothetical protein